MSELKDSFSALSHIPWSEVPLDSLPVFLHEAFTHAEVLANSVPIAPPKSSDHKHSRPTQANTAEKPTDTYAPAHPTGIDERNAAVQKVWGKPIKLSAKDNPLDVSVYKTAGHDRKGAWFARRSTHSGIGFTRWRQAMAREFLESVKVQKGPGSGAVRGIAGDKRLEKSVIDGVGKVEVWQLSSAFPGPVTPRGFFSLIMTSDKALGENSSTEGDVSSDHVPRHFLIISRPTTYQDATPNPHLVYGTYESVELIREIPEADNEDPEMNPVEWIMITRSDPGGGIPKFMVERGTPGSIVADVPKLIDWIIKLGDVPDLDETAEDALIERVNSGQSEKQDPAKGEADDESESQDVETQDTEDTTTSPQHGHSTLLGSLTSAVGATVAGYLPYLGYNPPGSYPADEDDDDDEAHSDTSGTSSTSITSSINTYASAPELRTQESNRPPSPLSLNSAKLREDAASTSTSTSTTAAVIPQIPHDNKSLTAHEKELSKLAHQRQALDARLAKAYRDDAKKAQELHDKEEHETARAAERRERERKKAEERHRREIEKLEERRVKEERRAEERARKAREKDALVRVTRERDEARERGEFVARENELLRAQVEELQRLNNSLVQRLGAAGEAGAEGVRKVRGEAAAVACSSSSSLGAALGVGGGGGAARSGRSRSRTSSRASAATMGSSGGHGGRSKEVKDAAGD